MSASRLTSVSALICSACVGAPSPLSPGLSGSVGVPHLGVQTDAVELPRAGEGYVRFRPQGQHYWGVPRLVEAIAASAKRVAAERPGGEPLVVGDLSARYGGKIQGHNSHRSGRDVDLLYYVTTPAGVPMRSPGFVRLAGDGLGYVPGDASFVRFDVERQWQLVKALLESPEIGVQFMFMSRELEALLIDYALARQEPLALVHHAQTVLIQPTDSLPHDDHLHLRIACAPEEGVTGCTGGGPYWPWLPEAKPVLPLDPQTLESFARDDPWQSQDVLAHGTSNLPGGA